VYDPFSDVYFVRSRNRSVLGWVANTRFAEGEIEFPGLSIYQQAAPVRQMVKVNTSESAWTQLWKLVSIGFTSPHGDVASSDRKEELHIGAALPAV
jgi:hypothetical protein